MKTETTLQVTIDKLTSENIRTLAFSTGDPLATPEEAAENIAAYMKLKALEAAVATQLKNFEKRLAAASEQHKDEVFTAQAVVPGINAATGQPEFKQITATVQETIQSKDELQSDLLRADLGISDPKVDTTTNPGKVSITFQMPTTAQILAKDLKVVPINDRAVKREIAMGRLDPKYVVTIEKPAYGITTTINTIKGAN